MEIAKPPVGAFAKRTFAKRALAKKTPTLSPGQKEALKRLQTNKVPTKKEAMDMAEAIARGVKKQQTVAKPFMVALIPNVCLKQP